MMKLWRRAEIKQLRADPVSKFSSFCSHSEANPKRNLQTALHIDLFVVGIVSPLVEKRATQGSRNTD